eukprot:CAMPEP_0172554180 /NCGR_PEP_ID=MMETSP1067-20121228/53541_1 /TAXON_ID=265564 ORGANISM="Thalassiosira punctigera, Strain Tpunct2005C2" /NCGR_SAMPLE_ID=MMETSP1067 /ASSEMBLY_ACC=CAM_ASM_000444 /LENGTH=249 /DNA_ID=CAMNT_0013342501 /DNA_START=22 /DNA_END=771 /DNA_ORIENTATION=-
MSKLSDYSKFDHLDSDSDADENDNNGAVSWRRESRTFAESPGDATSSSSAAAAADAATPTPPARGATIKHPKIAGRYIFSYGEKKVYEWEQSLEEVTIYIDAPMHQLPERNAASFIVVNILPNRLQVGLKGGDRCFIDEKTFDKVKTRESSWYLDDGVITIVLSKCFRGQTWEGVLCGHAAPIGGSGAGSSWRGGIRESIDPFTKQEIQRTLMLERFQEENPGFDFRDAKFNGEVPDPRTFMGGVGYNH